MPKKNVDDTSLVVASTAAIGSILVNVAQAIDRTNTVRQANALRRDRQYLLDVLRRFKKTYEVQRMMMLEARRENAQKAAEARKWQQDYERVEAKCVRQEAEIVQLKSRITAVAAEARDEGTTR